MYHSEVVYKHEMVHLRPANSSHSVVAGAGHLITQEKPKGLGKYIKYAFPLSHMTDLPRSYSGGPPRIPAPTIRTPTKSIVAAVILSVFRIYRFDSKDPTVETRISRVSRYFLYLYIHHL